MKNNLRFRNHFSVVIIDLLPTLLGLWIFMNLDIVAESEAMSTAEGIGITSIMVGIVGVLLIIINLVNWAKTYITLTDDMLIIERNTLVKKKNTIALKNISNVNLEQGLLSMLFGTCKVKLDTNTLSTANETDVTIVLKKELAEEFRLRILVGARSDDEPGEEHTLFVSDKIYEATKEDIVANGFFSLSFSVIIVFGVLVALCVWFFKELAADPEADLSEVISIILSIVVFTVGTLWGIIKKFITFIDFRAERAEDKIYISYGLLRKVTYSIPVGKINAIILKQTTFARLGKRYMVEIVNVGMGDEDKEERSFFLPYSKKERIAELISLLLPEFDGCVDIEEERQPASIWLIWIPKVMLYLAVAVAGTALVGELWSEYVIIPIICFAALGIWVAIWKIASFCTRGISLGDSVMSVSTGAFSKRRLFVRYEKVQLVISQQNPISKRFGIQKGNILLLASLANQAWQIPYTKDENFELIKNKLIK